jgi:hypothetical protein
MKAISGRVQRKETGDTVMMRTPIGERFARLKYATNFPPLRAVAWLVLLVLTFQQASARSDEFDRLEGASLFEIPGRAGTRAATALSHRELEGLPPVFSDVPAAFVLVKTDQGNLAKILVSAAFKKGENGASPVPVLILERFETIDSLDKRSFKARGKGVTLFEGLQYDLDSGQVVPEKMGGDIVCAPQRAGEPGLRAVGASRLYTLEKALPRSQAVAGQPSSGRAILVGDFNGRFDLVADGQWSGRLDLTVDALGNVSGSFRSEKNGTAYAVAGKAGEGAPQRIRFEIRFPRARQDYEGLIWSEGKNVIAGTVSMLDHPYSFVAVRHGASLWPGTARDLAPKPNAK